MKMINKGILPLLLLSMLLACDNEESDIQTDIKIPVSVVSIKPQSISRFIETTGTVYSSKEGVMKSEITGIYRLQTNPSTGKPFALGDAVKPGQVLVKLEDKEFVNGLQIDGKKLNLAVKRHGFHRADEIFRGGRKDFFLSGDQGDMSFEREFGHVGG